MLITGDPVCEAVSMDGERACHTLSAVWLLPWLDSLNLWLHWWLYTGTHPPAFWEREVRDGLGVHGYHDPDLVH